ncbi:unnamed protein product [Rotaria sp. Silwood2]|nr:unnamed protein product [Rotaria sp. Silwood2]CAF4367701.1 unnamed protein product [Rotaria sp. Silwood2]
MNLNAGFFAAYCYRRKQPTVAYRVPLNSQQHQHTSFLRSTKSSIDISNGSESFLPSIPTAKDSNNGQRPYRRNDFANNHLFIAKHKLARIFLNRPATNIQSTNDLIHLFDPYEPKEKNRRKNKNKQQENKSNSKPNSTFDQDIPLSVINLVMKPSLPSSQSLDSISTISYHRAQPIHFQTRTPRPSIAWINPAITQHFQSRPNYFIKDEFEPNTINPLDSSVLYVKSIITVAKSKQD